ncbi:MAG: Clp1/GlmU family protein [Candidatus Caldarchaeum sp.]
MQIPSGKTLLIDGPAIMKMLDGEASILNCPLSKNKEYFLRPWKRYPVYAHSDCKLDLRMGEESRASMVEKDDAVDLWLGRVNEINAGEVVGVLGGVDSGKTSFTTLAVNTLTRKHGRAHVLSLDPGQTYFSPPTLVCATELTKCIHDLAECKPYWHRPVGSTSAAQASAEVLKAAEEFSKTWPGDVSMIVDMDGWVDDGAAAAHKAAVLKTLGCSKAVMLGEGLDMLRQTLETTGVEVVRLPSSKNVKPRDNAERRKIREWFFRRHLGNTTLRFIPATWVQLAVVGHAGQKPLEYLRVVSQKLEATAGDHKSSLCKNRTGLIAYLFDEQKNYKGIGIACGYDPQRTAIKILTSVESSVRWIWLGCVVITAEGDEVLTLD